MLQFSLNLSLTVQGAPFLDRLDRAARLGFGAVEFFWPDGENLDLLVRRARDAGLQVPLFNFDAGSIPGGERGFLNDPGRERRFRENVPAALELADRLGCTQLNVLVGNWLQNIPRSEQIERARENLAWAAAQARDAGVTVLVEALNAWESPAYMLTSTRETLALLDAAAAPNLRLQYDVYHMQRMEGNVVATLREHVGRIGHIQVADPPGRHQPGTGELNFRTIFRTIDELGYEGAIGCEYRPLGGLEESLAWLPEVRRGPVPMGALRL